MPHLSPLTSHLSPSPSAWLHNPTLSLWLSVDPLSDKYPGVSPYAYCGNNPVRLVDVDGREVDEWDLLRDGTLRLRENGRTDVDIVHATDDNGGNTTLTLPANTISKQTYYHSGRDLDGKAFTTTYRSFADKDNALKFFEFAAENTDYEWAISSGESNNHVGTAQRGYAAVPSVKNELFYCHSHKTKVWENERETFSKSDYDGWEFYNKKGTSDYIYMTCSRTYYEYKEPDSFVFQGKTIYQHTKENWFPSLGPHVFRNH